MNWKYCKKDQPGKYCNGPRRKARKGTNLEDFIILARLWYRDLLALTCQAGSGQLVNQDRLTDLLRQQKDIPAALILERLEALSILQRQVRANLNSRISFK